MNCDLEIGLFVHNYENNNESQKHLDENRTHFNKQCQRLYEILMTGEVLTVENAVINHKIMSLPRRIKDLRKNGVMISEEWNRNAKPKVKEWFVTQKDKLDNTQKFI